VVLLFVSDLIQ